jgi:hypothetical protein
MSLSPITKPNHNQFTLYRDPRTRRVLTRYQILLKWYREHNRLSLNSARRSIFLLSREEQDSVIQSCVTRFGLVEVDSSTLNQNYKQLFLTLGAVRQPTIKR